ncbi:heavy-metal-associated domain-containing protein [Jiella sp. MQZ9-1]|uniref:Heavy-metal-associated domain-containing protein n=1 Tax=Jiella flava TaxID=2816857 RepID=A0A939FT58_9HYPH|nr:heavy-metal-associated domain-containing protein [Jiella flava]MBO0661463.1 heavy-metal-associated domain-containing protein [Jiella flava]MCD2470106.1 heavy-metal-associated domain-containing protein [Jiella flava]
MRFFQSATKAPSTDEVTVAFRVEDMTCGHCEATIRKALGEALPDRPVTVDRSAKTVTIQAEETAAKPAETAIREAGYTPERLGVHPA